MGEETDNMQQLWSYTCFVSTCEQTHREEREAWNAGSGWDHTSSLNIVTLSTVEPSPENKPLRWTALSFILFAWNSLLCCVWAFFCRMIHSTETEDKQSAVSRQYSDTFFHHPVESFLFVEVIRWTNIHLVISAQLDNKRLFCSTFPRSRILQLSVHCHEENESCLIASISHSCWCDYSYCTGTENRDRHSPGREIKVVLIL